MSLFSFFKNGIIDTTPAGEVTLEKLHKAIKEGIWKKEVEAVRDAPDKETHNKLKNNLSYVTFSGVFTYRDIPGFKTPSGLMCIDFDKLENPELLKEDLKKLDYVALAFISPSGNGVKCVIRVPPITSNEEHKAVYIAAAETMKATYDNNAADISRACFVSYDSDAYLNEKVVEFTPHETTQEELKLEDIDPYSATLQGKTEGERNDSLFKYACHLRENNINENETLLLCCMINQQNKPPLSETEVKACVKSAFKYKEPKTEQQGVVIDAEDLLKLDIPSVTWLIEGLIPEAGLTLIGGQPGHGKSLVALHTAINASVGLSFLGQYASKQCKVLFVDEENNIRILKERLTKLKRGEGINQPLNIVFALAHGLKLDSTEGVALLNQLVTQHQPSLIVLDSMVRFLCGDENEAKDVRRVFTAVKPLLDAGKTVIILHHVKKWAGNTQEALRGSGDFAAQADSILMVEDKRGGLYELTQAKNRVSKPVDAFEFKLMIAEDASMKLSYNGRKQKPLSKTEQAAKDVLAWAAPLGTFTTAECKEAMFMKSYTKSAVENAIQLLLSNRDIIKEGHGKYVLQNENEVTLSQNLKT